MSGRKIIIAGNWKMHKNSSETTDFVESLKKKGHDLGASCEVIVAPPFTSLDAGVRSATGSDISVSAQNVHWEDKGAFTGEISGAMLTEIGVTHAIIGHSERRQFFGETDETVYKRIKAAIRHKLIPIFCLGETLAERDAGSTFDVVRRQLLAGMGDNIPENADRFIIAYEPVWAIGTGKTATPEQAQEVHAFLRNELAQNRGIDFSNRVRILYGGSVKPDNTRELMKCPDIDGGLVGGASLKVDDFLGIIEQAS
ncbi:MAG: triose-phosphate isomerase [Syntrophaceae bacterium]|nr:triose-phosphate isomerase [Syntrophaceae bacterium]